MKQIHKTMTNRIALLLFIGLASVPLLAEEKSIADWKKEAETAMNDAEKKYNEAKSKIQNFEETKQKIVDLSKQLETWKTIIDLAQKTDKAMLEVNATEGASQGKNEIALKALQQYQSAIQEKKVTIKNPKIADLWEKFYTDTKGDKTQNAANVVNAAKDENMNFTGKTHVELVNVTEKLEKEEEKIKEAAPAEKTLKEKTKKLEQWENAIEAKKREFDKKAREWSMLATKKLQLLDIGLGVHSTVNNTIDVIKKALIDNIDKLEVENAEGIATANQKTIEEKTQYIEALINALEEVLEDCSAVIKELSNAGVGNPEKKLIDSSVYYDVISKILKTTHVEELKNLKDTFKKSEEYKKVIAKKNELLKGYTEKLLTTFASALQSI